MPPVYVKRGKNDSADAKAICEAVARPTTRFVAFKSREQQAALSLHRGWSLLIRQRTQLVNLMCRLLAKMGIAFPDGFERALQMAWQIIDAESELDLPAEAVGVITMLSEQMVQLHVQLRKLDLRLAALLRSNETARRLATIPRIGPVGATALAASVTDASQFTSGWQFAAWFGLTPRENSSGGKERLGRITRMGDKYLRQLLVIGATSLVRRTMDKLEAFVAPLARNPERVVSMSIPNKMAWIYDTRGELPGASCAGSGVIAD